MNLISENQIASTFKNSKYKASAVIQKIIAKDLALIINDFVKAQNLEPKKIFEIGVGTGLLTKNLFEFYANANWILNDLYKANEFEMDLKNKQNISFLIEDINSACFPENLDLIVSSSCFQWIKDFEQIIIKARNSLNEKNGLFCFSSFAEDNFLEIKKINKNTLSYLKTKEITKLLQNNGFEVLSYFEKKIFLNFEKEIDVLKHIKNTGVNGSFKSFWTKKDLQNFIYSYKEICPFKTVLTYNPNFFIAKIKQ